MKTIEVRHKGQTALMTYNGQGHVREIEKSGGKFFESWMLEAIARMPYRPGICLDIGANVGNHTVFFSRFCNFDEVWAYEPDKESFKILTDNVQKNCSRTVRLFHCAIGSERKYVRMTKKDEPPQNQVIHERGRTLVLPIQTNLKVALMKIDVEGYEMEVIKGAYTVIARELPELFIETHGDPIDVLRALPPAYSVIKRYNNSPTYHFSAT